MLPVGPGHEFPRRPRGHGRRSPDVEVLLTGWGCPRISPEVLDAAPKLRAIVHAAGSVKTIVDPAAFERGVQVSSAAAANALPVAEFTRRGDRAGREAGVPASRGAVPPRAAAIAGPHRMPGSSVRRSALLGASRIGRLVLERLRAFDLDVLMSDPYLIRTRPRSSARELVD